VTASRSRSRSSRSDADRTRAGAQPQGSDAERLVVGLVRGLHGLDGTVRVEVLTDHPDDRFTTGAVVFPEGTDRPLTIVAARPVDDGPGWRLRFREVTSRTAAEALRDVYLEQEVAREQSLDEDAVYWHEIIGASVLDQQGRELGRVRDVYRAGGAEVYVVGGGPAGEFDLPAVKALILEFAPREGRIVVDPEAIGLDVS
jgi:16S rRNA processing protein RimM